jgi:serine/threonine protein kinase
MTSSLLAPPEVQAPASERYELVDLIGRGGMGEVYKAWDNDLETVVALKSLRPAAAHDPKVLDRFRREAKLARRIKHVHVAQMHDLVEWRGQRYLSMEYVDGRSLKGILVSKGKLPVHVALSLMRQACAGVHAAHEVGVVHRDLKPHNVMVTRRGGRACILDFGIARELGQEDVTEVGVVLGSPQYLSYEQLAGQPASPRSDIYQLGLLLYELVTGIAPFRAPGAGLGALRAMREVPPDPRNIEPRLPTFVAEAVIRCLQRWPEDRFATALELQAALDPPRNFDDTFTRAQSQPVIEIDGNSVSISAPTALVAVGGEAERRAIVDRLMRLGCIVATANDGMDALQQAHSTPFSLVVLGASLPGVDGLTACQILKRSPQGAEMPVVLVLEPGDDGRVAFAREAGAAAVLHSPLNVHALSRTVRDLVKT